MHGYLEAIRQLSPENMTAIQKLGATLLAGLTGANTVELISAGATLDPQQCFALRTILNLAVSIGQPTSSLLSSAPKEWTRVLVTLQPNVQHAMLLVCKDGLYSFLEDSRQELEKDSRDAAVRILKEQASILLTDLAALSYQGQQHGCALYHLRIPAKAASIEGIWVPFLDLISAKR